MQGLPAGGVMVAVQATEDEIVPLLTAGVDIAAVNGPRSVVLAGVEEAVDTVVARFADRKSTRLAVSHAFHSVLMEPMLAEFETVAAELSLAQPTIPVVASGDVATPGYWVRHVRDTVRFADTVRDLESRGVTRFLELGPDGVLTAMAQQSIESESAVLVPILRKNRPEAVTAVSALGQLHASGVRVDWDTYFAGTGAQRVDLPTYAFQRQRFWLSPELGGGDPESFGQDPAGHPLLGAAVSLPGQDGVLFTGRLSVAVAPWLADHRMGESILFPGAGFVEFALHAGRHAGADALADLTLHAPLILSEDGAVQLRVRVADRTVTVHSRAEDEPDLPWTLHAEGTVTQGGPEPVDRRG